MESGFCPRSRHRLSCSYRDFPSPLREGRTLDGKLRGFGGVSVLKTAKLNIDPISDTAIDEQNDCMDRGARD